MIQLVCGSQVVGQDELEVVIELQNQIAHLQGLYHRQAGNILERILAGAYVEPGALEASLESIRSGGMIQTRLEVH